ncbi:MAG: hypothetical protein Q8O01_06595, partial [Candidatus Omnitrophota bacterium]|nr:hypothetical protein [Candidatus Omnitrophota bacterium]
MSAGLRIDYYISELFKKSVKISKENAALHEELKKISDFMGTLRVRDAAYTLAERRDTALLWNEILRETKQDLKLTYPPYSSATEEKNLMKISSIEGEFSTLVKTSEEEEDVANLGLNSVLKEANANITVNGISEEDVPNLAPELRDRFLASSGQDSLIEARKREEVMAELGLSELKTDRILPRMRLENILSIIEGHMRENMGVEAIFDGGRQGARENTARLHEQNIEKLRRDTIRDVNFKAEELLKNLSAALESLENSEKQLFIARNEYLAKKAAFEKKDVPQEKSVAQEALTSAIKDYVGSRHQHLKAFYRYSKMYSIARAYLAYYGVDEQSIVSAETSYINSLKLAKAAAPAQEDENVRLELQRAESKKLQAKQDVAAERLADEKLRASKQGPGDLEQGRIEAKLKERMIKDFENTGKMIKDVPWDPAEDHVKTPPKVSEAYRQDITALLDELGIFPKDDRALNFDDWVNLFETYRNAHNISEDEMSQKLELMAKLYKDKKPQIDALAKRPFKVILWEKHYEGYLTLRQSIHLNDYKSPDGTMYDKDARLSFVKIGLLSYIASKAMTEYKEMNPLIDDVMKYEGEGGIVEREYRSRNDKEYKGIKPTQEELERYYNWLIATAMDLDNKELHNLQNLLADGEDERVKSDIEVHNIIKEVFDEKLAIVDDDTDHGILEAWNTYRLTTGDAKAGDKRDNYKGLKNNLVILKRIVDEDEAKSGRLFGNYTRERLAKLPHAAKLKSLIEEHAQLSFKLGVLGLLTAPAQNEKYQNLSEQLSRVDGEIGKEIKRLKVGEIYGIGTYFVRYGLELPENKDLLEASAERPLTKEEIERIVGPVRDRFDYMVEMIPSIEKVYDLRNPDGSARPFDPDNKEDMGALGSFYDLAKENEWSVDESKIILQRIAGMKETVRQLLAWRDNVDTKNIVFAPSRDEKLMERVGFLFAFANDIFINPGAWEDFFDQDGKIIDEQKVRTLFSEFLSENGEKLISAYLAYMDKLGYYKKSTKKDMTSIILPIARELVSAISLPYTLEKELEFRKKIFDFAGQNNVEIFDGHLSYFSKYIKSLWKEFGDPGTKDVTGEFVDMLFRNIGHIQNIRAKAAARLLQDYEENLADSPEIKAEKDALRIRIMGSDGLKDDPMTFEGMVYLGTKYMLKKGKDYTEKDLFDEIKSQMYYQAMYMTYNEGEKLQLGDLGQLSTFAKNEGYKDEKIGKIIRYKAEVGGKIKELVEKIVKDLQKESPKKEWPEIESKAKGRFPLSTEGEIEGLVARMLQKEWNSSILEDMFDDIKFIQLEEYKTQGRFIGWDDILPALSQLRSDKEGKLVPFEKTRAHRRFLTTFKEDRVLSDLGIYDPTVRLWEKWRASFGEFPSQAETSAALELFGLSPDQIRKENTLPNRIIDRKNRINDFIERISSIFKSFASVMGRNMYERAQSGIYKDTENAWNANLNTVVQRRVKRLIYSEINRRCAIEEINEKHNIWLHVLSEPRFRNFTRDQRDKKREEMSAIFADKARLNEKIVEIQKLGNGKGIDITYNDAKNMVKMMAQTGHGEQEAIFIYGVTRKKVEDVYKAVYGKTKLSQQDKEVVAYISEKTGEKLAYMDSPRKEEMKNAARSAKKDRLNKMLEETIRDLAEAKKRGNDTEENALSERVKSLSKSIGDADSWEFESQLDVEVEGLKKTFEMAGKIDKVLKDFEKKTDMKIEERENNSRIIAAEAFGGGLTMDDINDWLDTTILLLETAKSKNVSLPVDKAMYIVDSWFKLGIAESIMPETFEREKVEAAVRKNFNEKEIGEAINERELENILTVMERKRISPVIIEFLLERAKNMKNEIGEAIRKEKEKSIFDRTKAPRSIYDLEQGITLKHLLTYLDDNLSFGIDNKIGLVDIFGYKRDFFEKVINRPINAMYNVREDEMLLKAVPKEVRQAGWSWIEKARHNSSEYMQNNETFFTNVLIRALLSIIALYAVAYFALFRRGSVARRAPLVAPAIVPAPPAAGSTPAVTAPAATITPATPPASRTSRLVISKNKIAMFAFILFTIGSWALLFWFGAPSTIAEPGWAFTLAGASIWTFAVLAITIVKWAIKPPWKGLSRRGDATDDQVKDEMAKERQINLTRHLPYHTVKRFITTFATLLAISTINFNSINLVVLAAWALTFYYLMDIIMDVYLLKFPIFLVGWIFGLVKKLEPEIDPREIDDSKSFVSLNPIRPDNDEQFKKAVAKNMQMLYKTNYENSEHKHNVISIMILQAYDDNPETFKRYYRVMNDMIYSDNATMTVDGERNSIPVPQHVKDSFYAFCMGGIAKPHNFYKVMRWLYQEKEEGDPTNGTNKYRDIYGVKTEKSLPKDVDAGIVPHYGVDDKGRYGITMTQGGLNNLRRLRQEGLDINGKKKKPLIQNGLIVDADNYATPSTVSRMINTMDDKFMVWQPRISFYNAQQSIYSYIMKETPNAALGVFNQTANMVIEGGIRSFGKYFFRLNTYYQHEVAGSHPFQNAYEVDRTYYQNEDAIHSVYERVGFVPQAIIYESTPTTILAEEARDINKWLPTFDIRAFMLTHVPIVKFVGSKTRLIGYSIAFGVIFALLVLFASMSGSYAAAVPLGLFALFAASLSRTLGSLSLYSRLEMMEILKNKRFPKTPLRAVYAESLVTRGIFSEIVWLIQITLTFYAMFTPGTLEIALPYLGELLFLGVMVLLTVPKFYGTLTNRILGITGPKEKDNIPKIFKRGFPKFLWNLGAWVIHDIPTATLELCISTSVYLSKLISKPIAVFKGFRGTRTEMEWQLKGVSSPSTWPSFVESSANPPLIRYLIDYRLSISIGLSAFILALFGTSLGNSIHLSSWVAYIVVSLAMFVMVFLPLKLSGIRKEMDPNTNKEVEKWSKHWVTGIVLIILAGTMFLVACPNIILNFIPVDLILRASTIIVAAFIFGPGVAWLAGQPLVKEDPSTSPPTVRSFKTKALSVVLGFIVILIGIYTTSGYIPFISGNPIFAGFLQSASGGIGVMAPAFSFGNLLRIPWIFSIFFNTLVWGAIGIGIFGYIIGAFDNLYWRSKVKYTRFKNSLYTDGADKYNKFKADTSKATPGEIDRYIDKEIVFGAIEEQNFDLTEVEKKRETDWFKEMVADLSSAIKAFNRWYELYPKSATEEIVDKINTLSAYSGIPENVLKERLTKELLKIWFSEHKSDIKIEVKVNELVALFGLGRKEEKTLKGKAIKLQKEAIQLYFGRAKSLLKAWFNVHKNDANFDFNLITSEVTRLIGLFDFKDKPKEEFEAEAVKL